MVSIIVFVHTLIAGLSCLCCSTPRAGDRLLSALLGFWQATLVLLAHLAGVIVTMQTQPLAWRRCGWRCISAPGQLHVVQSERRLSCMVLPACSQGTPSDAD
jgi:hypothetical protein